MRASPHVHRKRDTLRVVFGYVVRSSGPLGLMAQAAMTATSIASGTGGAEPAPALLGRSAAGLDPHGG
jgi:hypothetical protein